MVAAMTSHFDFSTFFVSHHQPRRWFNPLTTGAAYIRVFIFYQHIKYDILNMLKIKCDINQQDLKNLNNFHTLEVVDRVSETQLQVGENSNWIIWRLKS